MPNVDITSVLARGANLEVTKEAQAMLARQINGLQSDIQRASENSPNPYGNGETRSKDSKKPIKQHGNMSMYTTLSDMINGTNKDIAGFGTLLDSLYAKNKKYFTIIKDYEIMPILIPQVNRVLDFLVNECLSPDIQNDRTFIFRYVGEGPESATAQSIQKNIDSIRHEMKLDSLLREVYMNRFKLGREYYMVQDYAATFDHMLDRLKEKRLGESAGVPDGDYLSSIYPFLRETINEVSCTTTITAVDRDKDLFDSGEINESVTQKTEPPAVCEATIPISLKDANIIVERSCVPRLLEEAYGEVIHEDYSRFSSKNLLRRGLDRPLNEETAMDMTKFEQIVDAMKKKKLKRCTITRFDPAKMFKLKVGGKVIGYFNVTDVNESTANVVNFSQALKDQLLKSRAANLSAASQSAEESISKELAQRIINAFDPTLGISRVEDIDLLHDFIRNNEIYKGNKRITFYYEDEIFDLSRSAESILINAVFFTKLYATLLLNNIITKVLRGRGRQIHTVRLGVSANVRRYIDNAMASLAMPEHNLGTLHGSFEQIMNPFNGASDIVIPTEDDGQKYIETDYVPGQDVDMNDEFLRTLLNSIVTSFGLDSAVLDTTNGNLQFARTLSMDSLQIANSVKNEQQDLHDPWESMCLEILKIMGDEATRNAAQNGQIDVKFFEPKTLLTLSIIDELNNTKTMAEGIADIMPELNIEGTEALRARFIYDMVKSSTNLDFGNYEKLLNDAAIEAVHDAEKRKLHEISAQAEENVSEEDYQPDADDDDMGGLSAEERAIMDTPLD